MPLPRFADVVDHAAYDSVCSEGVDGAPCRHGICFGNQCVAQEGAASDRASTTRVRGTIRLAIDVGCAAALVVVVVFVSRRFSRGRVWMRRAGVAVALIGAAIILA